MAKNQQQRRKPRNPRDDDERCPVCFAFLKDIQWAGSLRVCDVFNEHGSYRRLMCGANECMRRAAEARVYFGRRLADFTDLNSLTGWSNWAEDIGVIVDVEIVNGKYGRVVRPGARRGGGA